MSHPKSQRCRQLAKLFREVRTKYPAAHLDMSEPVVLDNASPTPHACGTVHCHGGWAMVLLAPEKLAKAAKSGLVVTYDEGADVLARFLCDDPHSNGEQLKAWADRNPEVWGNAGGWGMFSSEMAFNTPTGRGARNLKDIAYHWGQVAGRLAKLEKHEEAKCRK